MAENPRIEELRRKLDREPGSRLFAQLAEELRKDGDLEGAIRVARVGLTAHPNYPSARMTLGRALFDSGKLSAARAEFETVLRGVPDNILASRSLAECLEAMGDLGSALLQYRALLRMAPGDRQLEAQIRSIEQRLAPPGSSTGLRPTVPPAPPATPPAPSRSARVPLGPEVIPPAAPFPVAAPPPRPSPRPEPPALSVPAATAFEGGFEWEPAEDGTLRPSEPSARPAFDLETTIEDRLEVPPPPARPAGPAPARPAWPPPAPPAAPPFARREPPALAPAVPPAVEPPPAPRSPEPPPAPRSVEPPPAPGGAAPPVPASAEPLPAELDWELPPAAPPAPTPGEPPPALSSATLAELYFRQGFAEKAVEVYEQLRQREPGNERVRARLAELSAIRAVSSRAAPETPARQTAGDERAERRGAIEGRIARLEELLAAVRRHAPAGGIR